MKYLQKITVFGDILSDF